MIRDGQVIQHLPDRVRWINQGQLHRVDGPAVIYRMWTPDWYINDNKLDNYQIFRAREILRGDLEKETPLYINDPILKYFCATFLERGPTTWETWHELRRSAV